METQTQEIVKATPKSVFDLDTFEHGPVPMVDDKPALIVKDADELLTLMWALTNLYESFTDKSDTERLKSLIERVQKTMYTK